MKPTVIELFAHAAERARDVAVMMDAARALTVLGRARLATEPAADGSGLIDTEVFSLYQTAERLGHHVRQMSSEARTLLVTAKQMLETQPQPVATPHDFHSVCEMMDQAMARAVEAVDRLDAMRLSMDATAAATPGDAAAAEPTDEVRHCTDALFQRLRFGSDSAR